MSEAPLYLAHEEGGGLLAAHGGGVALTGGPAYRGTSLIRNSTPFLGPP